MEANFSDAAMNAYNVCIENIKNNTDSPDAYYQERKQDSLIVDEPDETNNIPRYNDTLKVVNPEPAETGGGCTSPGEFKNSQGICVQGPAPGATPAASNGQQGGGATKPSDSTGPKNQDSPNAPDTPANKQATANALAQEAEADLMTCKADYKKAAQCCMNPVACAGGSDMAQQGLGLATAVGASAGGAMMMDAGMQMNANPNSQAAKSKMKGICDALRLGSMGAAAANVGLGAVCSNAHNTCEDTCEVEIQKWTGRKAQDGATHAALINNTLRQLKDYKAQCGSLATQATQMMAQGASTGTAAALFDQCSQLTAQTQSTGFENMNLNRNIDCTSATYINTAYCVDCTKNPANPYCPKPGGTVSGPVGTISTRSVGTQDANKAFNVDSIGDGVKQSGIQPSSIEASKAQGMESKSGGSMLGGAGGAGGAGGDPNRNPGAGAKPSADILQGERSGGGYSVSSMGGAGEGGYAGYGGGGGGSGRSDLKGFDLKKYLPGQEKDPAARRIAAVGDPSKVINSKHDCDLFACVTRRVTLICAQDRLMECSRANSATKSRESL